MKDSTGRPVANATVYFSVEAGTGGIVANPHQRPQTYLEIKTDKKGLAHVDFRPPFVPNAKYQQPPKKIISTVYAADKDHHQVAFTVTTTANLTMPPSPTNFYGHNGADPGEIDLSWNFEDHEHVITYFQIQISTDNINWTTAAVVQDPDARSFAVKGLTVGQSYYFQISAGNGD